MDLSRSTQRDGGGARGRAPLKIIRLRCAIIGGIRWSQRHGPGHVGSWTVGISQAVPQAHFFKDYVIGEDPTDVHRAMPKIRRTGALKPGGSAVSAIEIALWDIAGQPVTTPRYDLPPHYGCHVLSDSAHKTGLPETGLLRPRWPQSTVRRVYRDDDQSASWRKVRRRSQLLKASSKPHSASLCRQVSILPIWISKRCTSSSRNRSALLRMRLRHGSRASAIAIRRLSARLGLSSISHDIITQSAIPCLSKGIMGRG